MDTARRRGWTGEEQAWCVWGMARRSQGPASLSVKISRGPDPRPLHFYSTNYSIRHANHPGCAEWQQKREQQAVNRGTGYSANFRPAIYYSPSLDQKDNPHMLQLLSDNYKSLTARHFQQHWPATQPVAITTTTTGPAEPAHCPVVIVRPRPLTSEPKPLSETKSTFTIKQFRDSGVEHSCHSQREETGFTHAQNIEPITFQPPQAFCDLSPPTTSQLTGQTVMKRDFLQRGHTTGKEGIPRLSMCADQSNGYVKGSNYHSLVQPKAHEMVGYTAGHQLHPSHMIRDSKIDPAHFSTITHPNHFSSYTHHVLENGRREGGRDGRVQRGRQELTGYSENNQPLPQPSSRERHHFFTHYSRQFSALSLHSCRGGVASHSPTHNGFSKGTQVHGFRDGRGWPGLRTLHPSQARLTLLKDPCYEDHTHHSKKHSDL